MLENKTLLQEYIAPSVASHIVESVDSPDGKGRDLYLKGICIQGGVKNHNQRIYPVDQIARAVDSIKTIVRDHGGVCGEVDHPDDLKINLDRVSHMITDMWMEGANGYGKMKIIPTPMGNLIRTMLESGVKLGVSSRGSGNVNESNGHVSDFEMVTVDIVAQPSAPNAYPKAIYEGLLNMRYGHRALEMSRELQSDPAVQKHLKKAVLALINELKI
jgi:hypothetical protein